MKIFSAAQIREWDQYTIAHEPVTSVDLMERAASRCYDWLIAHFAGQQDWWIFCGTGNNGGDGLVIARKLSEAGKTVHIFINGSRKPGSRDFEINLQRAGDRVIPVIYVSSLTDLPAVPGDAIIIDALFGTGLNKPLTGLSAGLVQYINNGGNKVIAIDLPSGLFADQPSAGSIVEADITLSFQSYKKAFIIPENSRYTGKVVILDIGLSKEFEATESTDLELVETPAIRKLHRKRDPFAHKGSMGHAALIAGSWGMLGAAILAARACLRSGAGKLTCFVTPEGYPILQACVPEAIFVIDQPENIHRHFTDTHVYSSVGIGPGIGNHPSHTKLLQTLFTSGLPLVLDADALNHISAHPSLLTEIPPNSIITPHFKEFERLFGPSLNGFDRLDKAMDKAKTHGIHIILKGHFSITATPQQKGFINSTGNPGMATGGTGDVLTGILTGLLAQGYTLIQACLVGNYLHGRCGDLALGTQSEESLIASDLICSLGKAFNEIANKHPEI